MQSLIVSNPKTAPGYSPQRELIYEGMTSFGSYEPFGVARNVKLNTVGVEYDRELHTRLFHARLDYVTEVLPVVILTQSLHTDFWGDSIGAAQKTVHGGRNYAARLSALVERRTPNYALFRHQSQRAGIHAKGSIDGVDLRELELPQHRWSEIEVGRPL